MRQNVQSTPTPDDVKRPDRPDRRSLPSASRPDRRPSRSSRTDLGAVAILSIPGRPQFFVTARLPIFDGNGRGAALSRRFAVRLHGGEPTQNEFPDEFPEPSRDHQSRPGSLAIPPEASTTTAPALTMSQSNRVTIESHDQIGSRVTLHRPGTNPIRGANPHGFTPYARSAKRSLAGRRRVISRPPSQGIPSLPRSRPGRNRADRKGVGSGRRNKPNCGGATIPGTNPILGHNSLISLTLGEPSWRTRAGSMPLLWRRGHRHSKHSRSAECRGADRGWLDPQATDG